MASATYTTESGKFSRQLVYLVKLTVPGDVAGSQIFYFSLREGPTLSHLLGADIRPTVKSIRGRTTRIKPDEALTERASVTIQFFDDPNEGAFSASVFSVTTGGTFWKRLLVTQPVYDGWTVEIKKGFYATGFTLSDFEPFFKGRTEDIGITEQGEIALKCKGSVSGTDKEAPPTIRDQNVVTAALTTTSSTITVFDATEITNPTSLSSKNYFPVVLRLGLENDETEEEVIIKSISGNTLTVQDNYLYASEDFSNTTYWVTAGTTTITTMKALSPFGGAVVADKIVLANASASVAQTSSLVAASTTRTFSVWLITVGSDTAETVTIRLSDATNSQNGETSCSVTNRWTRFTVTKTFTGGASGNCKCWLIGVSASSTVYAYGAQLENGSSVGFYVGTNTTNAGASAGRGAFGSSASVHNPGKFKEVLVYRNHLSEEGVHPVYILRDLINRMEISTTDVSENSFYDTFEISQGWAFRRGRSTNFDDSTITDSANLTDLMKEVREQSLLDIWESESGQVTAGAAWDSYLTTETRNEVSDEENILLRGSKLDMGVDQRVSRVFVHFNKIEGTAGTEPAHFENKQVHLNSAGETVGGKRTRVYFSKWIYTYGTARSLAGKLLSIFLYGAKRYTMRVDIKDDLVLTVGSLFELDSDDHLKAVGSVATRVNTIWRVVQKTEELDGTLVIEAMKARQNKYGTIAPAGTPNYDSASAAEKKYCFIADTNNDLGAANDDGYSLL